MLPVIVLNLSAAITIAPTVGAVTFSGNAPTVQIQSHSQYGSLLLALSLNCTNTGGVDHTVNPTVGSLSFSGGTPTATGAYVVSPTVGSLSLSGGTPVAGQDRVATLSVGSLALSGGTPQANVGFSITPSVGALSLGGSAPSLRLDFVASPSVGSLALSGQTPTASKTSGCRSFGPLIIFGMNLDPLVGSDVLSVIPSSTALTFTVGTPEVTQSGFEDVPSDELVSDPATTNTGDLHGFKNAGVSQPEAFPSTAALTFAGGTPTVTNSLSRLPTVGYLTLTGNTVTLDRGVGVQSGAASFSGGTPSITVATPSVTPGSGTLTLTGGALTASRGYYNTYGTLISGRAYIVKYNDQFGSGDLSSLPAVLNTDINRGCQGEGTFISGSATIDASTWELALTDDETWTCQDDESDTWTTVTDITEVWTNV